MPLNSPPLDVIVEGLGTIGSAAAFHLAGHKAQVLGLEQFAAGHAKGSSHGLLRLIRRAYFEHEDYVPLVQRSYELWAELSHLSGEKLFEKTGLIIAAAPDNVRTLPGIRRASTKHGIAIEELSATEMKKRFPALHFPQAQVGIFEAGAGALWAEKCVRAHQALAVARGARLQFDEKVLRWESKADHVEVQSNRGHYRARSLILSTGAWMLPSLGEKSPTKKWPLRVERVPQLWYAAGEEFSAARGAPGFACDLETDFIYGFPKFSDLGVKIASHRAQGAVPNPDQVDREMHARDVENIEKFRKKVLPDLAERTQASICLYTSTPDENFLIDRHPDYENVFVASPCSGHGFKFSPVIGEILAELALHGTSPPAASFLKYRSFV